MKTNLTHAQKWPRFLIWAVLLGLLVAACGPAAPQDAVTDAGDASSEEGESDVANTVAGSQVTASGLEYIEIEAGTGPRAQPGDLVSVHYTGTLEDGTEFDSSSGGDPFPFVLGEGRVIRGWDEGIALMNVGGKAQLIIPPDLGYGDTDYGPIPGGSTLYFDVELVSSEPAPTPVIPPTAEPPTAVNPDDFTTTDSGLQYAFLEEGDGETPEPGEVASVSFAGWLEDGTKFADSQDGVPLDFIVGEEQILPGWDEMVLLMQVGDVVQFILPPELGLGEEGAPNGVIPPNATLIFEMGLVTISPPPPTPTPAPPPTSIEESDYIVTDTGLKFFMITEGSGELIEAGDQVTLHYTMWDEEGNQLETSFDFGQPVPIIAGAGQAGPGWDEALLMMSSSGKAQFVLTPELAYGEQAANAPTEGNLIFEIEIVDVVKAETE
ncbi:MAG: FKBP-type peptidyl-prolyl cis-trans isomerase [Anaerolineales bacterium]|nr:FKBP-type peptidyl-prolyl cis-trans isomerase [Anaerolineales bacterium]